MKQKSRWQTRRRGCDRFRDRCGGFFSFLHLLSRRCARVAAGTTPRRRWWHFFLNLAAQRHRRWTEFVKAILPRRRCAIRRRTRWPFAGIVYHQVLVALFTIALLSGKTCTALIRYTIGQRAWRTILDTYMAYVFILLLFHLLQWQVIVMLGIGWSRPTVFFAFRWRYRTSLEQCKQRIH